MEAGDKIIHEGDSFTVQKVYKTGWGDDSTLVFLMVKDVMPKPDIRWERIPDVCKSVYVAPSFGLRYYNGDPIFGGDCQGDADDWAFPNWRAFIKQTFERPKGGEA